MTQRLKTLARLLLLAALALPSLAFEPHAQHAFWAPELLALRVLAPLAFLAALAWRLASGSREGLDASLKQGRDLLGPLIGLWVCSALAQPERWDLGAQELSQWLAYPMLFAASWWLAENEAEREKIVWLILLAGGLQALCGLAQSLGQDPWAWSASFGGRASGFLGNPNFLGGHLALLLPLALALAWNSLGLRRFLAWGLVAVSSAALIATQTRGAWIGAAAGRALLAWLSQRLKALAGLLGCGLGLGLAFLALHPGSLQRLNSGEELERRAVLMHASASLALQHPLLGVGPGRFRISFPSVQAIGLDPQAPTRPYIYSENAHNDLLQMAAESGIPALLAYLLLLAWLFRALWKGSQRSALAAGCLGGLLALQVHGLANFPFLIAPTQATAWALAAIGLRACEAQSGGREVLAWTWIQKLGLALGLALALALAFISGRLFSQDMLWWVGQGESKLGNYPLAEPKIAKALRLNPYEDRLWFLRGLTQAGLLNSAHAAESFAEAVRLNPHDAQARVEWGKALLGLRQPAQAAAALLPAVEDAPNFEGLWEPLGLAKGGLGKYSEALDCLKRAPESAHLELNLAVSYFKMGDKAHARQALERAQELGAAPAELRPISKALR